MSKRLSDNLPRFLLAFRVLGTALVAFAGFDAVRRDAGNGRSNLLLTLDAVVSFPALIACIWWPRIGALLAIATCGVAMGTRTYPMVLLVAPVAVFSTIVAKHHRYAVAVAAMTLVVAIDAWVRPPRVDVMFWLAAPLLLAAAGLALSIDYMLAARRRAAATLEARMRLHELAQRAERQRLAISVHDHIGHAFAVASLVAGKHVGTEDPVLAEAFRRIQSTCADGARHLADAVALLRQDERHDTRQPVLPSEVAASVSETLTECGWNVTSSFDEDIDALPTSTRALIVRLLTEATTNVLKHGRAGGEATFTGEVVPSGYRIQVTNTTPHREPSPGVGLTTLASDALDEDATLNWTHEQGTWRLRLDGRLEDIWGEGEKAS